MPDEPVRLRPIEEADLDLLSQLDTDPAASQPFEWPGFRDPGARRRRWEQHGWIGRDSTHLAVALPDGTLAGIVSWRTVKAGGPEGGCLEIGALLFPEHRGRRLGTAAQRLLVEYLYAAGQPAPGDHRCREPGRAAGAGAHWVPSRGGDARPGLIGGRWRDGVPDCRENAGARFDKGRLVERGAEPDQEVAA